MEHISTEDKETEFAQHLGIQNNKRILFSGPFGSGKTYFLKRFFEARKEEYEVFHLFPVNYSVAANEDILDLLKFDLLMALLGKDVKFEKEDATLWLAAYNWLNKDSKHAIEFSAENFLLPFVDKIPYIGEILGKAAGGLLDVKKELKGIQKELKIDEEQAAKAFLESIVAKKGSIYGEDPVSLLISNLIERLTSNGNKKSVLIIDDLDRIDPEHIFRLLNVFSAHFDRPLYNIEEQSNKFNIEKIIFSCDQPNIRSIYYHKYGSQSDFEGYINKFYSSSVFDFDNTSLVQKCIRSFQKQLVIQPDTLKEYYCNKDYYCFVMLNNILIYAIYTHAITPRILENKLNSVFYFKEKNITGSAFSNSQSNFSLLVEILIWIFGDCDNLMQWIGKCKSDLRINNSYVHLDNFTEYRVTELLIFVDMKSLRSRKIELQDFPIGDHKWSISAEWEQTFSNQFINTIFKTSSCPTTNGKITEISNTDFFHLFEYALKNYLAVWN